MGDNSYLKSILSVNYDINKRRTIILNDCKDINIICFIYLQTTSSLSVVTSYYLGSKLSVQCGVVVLRYQTTLNARMKTFSRGKVKPASYNN